MTLQELAHLVASGEGAMLEFKRKVPQSHRIAKEVIAFANTMGGQLLLGVDDDGTIVGVKDAEETKYVLEASLAQHCVPPVPVALERVQVTRKREVIVVRVPASDMRPHKLQDESGREIPYVRVRDMSLEASREAVRLMRRRGEEEVRFVFGDKELKLMRYLEEFGRITVEQFSQLVHIPKRSASHTLVLLTRANVLQHHLDADRDFFTRVYPKS